MKVLFNPKVSILIPLYNSEQYIAESIESCLSQTYKNIEIIIVDDGSSDNSLDIAKSFEQSNIIVITQKNKGATSARNTAFNHSTGDYIQYLDADDILSSNKIEDQINLLSKFDKNFISSCPWGRFISSPEEAKIENQETFGDFKPVEWLVSSWQGGGMMQTACWLTPRTLFNEIEGWNESLKNNPNDDGEFFSRIILQSAGIKYCDKAKVYYRSEIKGSVSRNKSGEAVKSLLKTLILYEENILKVENSYRTKNACAHNYQSFRYQFFNTFPGLDAKAKERLSLLKLEKLPIVGGRNFKKFAKIFGFENTLKLKKLFLK